MPRYLHFIGDVIKTIDPASPLAITSERQVNGIKIITKAHSTTGRKVPHKTIGQMTEINQGLKLETEGGTDFVLDRKDIWHSECTLM